jgi:DNA-binding MarR family transcriptional regulator
MTSCPEFLQTIRQFLDIVLHHLMSERFQIAKANGLSMQQLGILMQLHHRGNCGISDLSDRFDITAAAASQLVDKLVQSGLIRREEDPHDRRAKLVNLTEKGKELVRQAGEAHYRWVDQLAGKLTADQRTQISEALIILTEAVREIETETSTHIHPPA